MMTASRTWQKGRAARDPRAARSRAIKERARTKARPPAPRDVLLALLACEPPDPAAALIAQLGMDRAFVCERLNW